MSSKDRKFIQFGPWAPDTQDYDNPALEAATNVTPSYGAHRPVDKGVVASDSGAAGSVNVTGGYSHLSSQRTPVLLVKIIQAQNVQNNWYTKEFELLDDALASPPADPEYGIDEVTGDLGKANDTTWIRTSQLIGSGASAREIDLLFDEPTRTPTIPSTTGDITFKVRLREMGNRAGFNTHKFLWEFREDGVSKQNSSYTITDPDSGEWEDVTIEITNTVIDAITDWDKLSLFIECQSTATVPFEDNKVPVADHHSTADWQNENGATEDLWDSINNMVNGLADTSAYAIGPALTEGQSSTIMFEYEPIALPPDPEAQGHACYSLVASKSGENMSCRIRILQLAGEDENEENVWVHADTQYRVFMDETWDNIDIDPLWTTASKVLADGYDWAQNADPSQPVFVSYTFTYAGSGTSAQTYMVPTSKKAGSWTGSIGDIDNVSDGNEANATDAGYTKTFTGFVVCDFNISDGPFRTSKGGHTLHVRAKTTQPASVFQLDLYQGETLIKSKNFTPVDNDFNWYEYTLTTSQVDKITDYNDLVMRVGPDHQGTSGTFTISELYFEYPGDSARPMVFETYVSDSPNAHFEFSDIRMETTDPKNKNIGDANQLYVGTPTKLYEVTDLGWEDVTRTTGGNYGGAGLSDIPRLWSFTSWGDDIIATNYADKIQRRVLGATDFTDLYATSGPASPETPQARFVATISGSLVLADINPTSYTDGKSFHIWCSYLLDPTRFDAADIDNQSALFPLIGRPGAITGLVGGEDGWVFKRGSIWRLSYVGLPPIFQFDLVADGIGCDHPNSIVSAGGDVYFWGGGAIHRMGLSGYQRLSGQRIEKHLFDSAYEGSGIYNQYIDDPNVNEGLVWGAFDSYSGLIWWLYRNNSADQYKMDKCIIYSIIEDRFTSIDQTDFDMSVLLGVQNTMGGGGSVNKGIVGIQKQGTKVNLIRFTDDTSYACTLKTKIMSPASFGYEDGVDLECTAIRPIFVTQQADPQAQGTTLPGITFDITAAQDPTLRVGAITRTADTAGENRQGWIPIHPMQGEFWQVTVNIPEMYRATIKEFAGVQMQVNRRGHG